MYVTYGLPRTRKSNLFSKTIPKAHILTFGEVIKCTDTLIRFYLNFPFSYKEKRNLRSATRLFLECDNINSTSSYYNK